MHPFCDCLKCEMLICGALCCILLSFHQNHVLCQSCASAGQGSGSLSGPGSVSSAQAAVPSARALHPAEGEGRRVRPVSLLRCLDQVYQALCREGEEGKREMGYLCRR